jgi:hypothetical protein
LVQYPAKCGSPVIPGFNGLGGFRQRRTPRCGRVLTQWVPGQSLAVCCAALAALFPSFTIRLVLCRS